MSTETNRRTEPQLPPQLNQTRRSTKFQSSTDTKNPAKLVCELVKGNLTATQNKQIILLSVAHLNYCTSPYKKFTDRLFDTGFTELEMLIPFMETLT